MQIKQLPTTELSLHSVARGLPRLDVDSPEFAVILASVKALGLPEPLKVNQFRIITGHDLWEAAKQLGLATVPCVEVEGHDLHQTILSSLLARRHFTKGQLAYLAFPHLDGALAEAKKRRLANLKKGLDSSQVVEIPERALSAHSGNTAADLAKTLGISMRLFTYAAQIHREFAADGALREKFEPCILDQEEDGAAMGLGAVIAGIAGYKTTKNVTPMYQPELLIWQDRVGKIFSPKRWLGWDRTSQETRVQIAEAFARNLRDTCPAEILAAVEIKIWSANQPAKRA